MDGITAEQIRSGQLWEATERKNSALVQVLKQVCSRNKALERQQLWQQKDREDHGSRSCITLKSRDGEVRSITRVPAGAKVTDNNTNKYARERAKLADQKEDCQLERFCDGNDSAWRPDTFLRILVVGMTFRLGRSGQRSSSPTRPSLCASWRSKWKNKEIKN